MNVDELNFEKICRVCCTDGQMRSVFKADIRKRLMACASVQVWENDGLPTQICLECLANLHIAFQFKRQCQKSDARLRSYLNSMETYNTLEISQEENYSRSKSVEVVEEEENSQYPQQQNNQNFLGNARVYEGYSINIAGVNDIIPLETLPEISEDYSAAFESYTCEMTVGFETYNVQPQTYQQNTLEDRFASSSSENADVLKSVHRNTNSLALATSIQQDGLKIDENTEKNKNKGKLPNCVNQASDTTSDQNNTCDTCGKHFKSTYNLITHKKTIHSDATPYRCKVCHKGFKTNTKYKVHFRIHVNDRPYRCTLCGYAFRRPHHLKNHAKTHTDERPYVCQVCNKAFARTSTLRVHLKIHSRKKRYGCSICPEVYSKKYELAKHFRTHRQQL